MDQQTEHDLAEVDRWQMLVAEAIKERDCAIRAAYKRGATVPQIAQATGLSLDQVHVIRIGHKVLPQGWLRVRLGEEEPSRDINAGSSFPAHNIGYPR